jgi:6-phosphogluconolactonase
VDDKSKFVFVGNYSSGTLSAIPIQQDGSLNAGMQTVTHQGGSINTSRQEKPHVHAVVLSPDQRYLFTPDLGTDKVNAYRVDVSNPEPLKATGEVVVKAGAGPRHLTFHPNGKLAYLVQELDASIMVFDFKDGKLSPKQTISMLAPSFNGNVGAADIHVSPDGKFLYGSNRGDANEIAIYAVAMDGKLSYVGGQSTLGKTPRNFAIDPSGNFLLAANQNSDVVIIFKRDIKTGLLSDTGKKILVDRPVCLTFVSEN